MKKFGLFTGTLELSRDARRLLILLMYSVDFGLIVYWNSPGAYGFSTFTTPKLLTLMGVTIFAAIYLVLSLSTRGLADRFTKSLRGPPLDERQILLRNRTYFRAYLILGIVMFFFWSVANNLRYGWMLLAFISFYASLPTALVAWLEPDPLVEDIRSEPREELT